MNIGIPIAAYKGDSVGEYVRRALSLLGHQTKILSQAEFYTAFRNKAYDLFFCVDSCSPLNLFDNNMPGGDWSKIAFWMVDFRRGRILNFPSDIDTCLLVNKKGGWIFQAQYEDMLECFSSGIKSVSWLPLGADPSVWGDTPLEAKTYDVGFVGSIHDDICQRVLDDIQQQGLLLSGVNKMESGASQLRKAKVGFNISSFFGQPEAFDVNRRVFETLSCGLPLVTNSVLSLARIFSGDLPKFVWTYSTFDQIIPTLRHAVNSDEFQSYGREAREWILQYGTYELRMETALDTLRQQGKLT